MDVLNTIEKKIIPLPAFNNHLQTRKNTLRSLFVIEFFAYLFRPFMQSHKKVLRKKLLHERRRLSKGEIAFKSRRITERLLALPETKNARFIHIFWPIQKNNEVDTRYLVRELVASSKQCVLPRIISYAKPGVGKPRMEHCLYSGETNLRANRWDVYEPVCTTVVPVSRIDVIIVPALAVDNSGIRIGYGKGYYDELLAEANSTAICVVFDSFLLNKLPAESHDIPVDIILTERTLVRL